MRPALVLYVIVAVKASNLTTKSPEEIIVPNLERIAFRKSFVNEIFNIFGDLKTGNATNNTVITKRSDELTYSLVLYSFLNKTYTCGSNKSKEIAPDLLATIEAISQLPFMDYIITDAVKINTVNTVRKCASDSKRNKPRKRKSKKKKNIIRTKNKDTFFTGAFDDSIATKEKVDKKVVSIDSEKLKDFKSNNAVIDQFRAILDSVIDDIDSKYSKNIDGKLVKVIFEIGDNLKNVLNKNSDVQEKVKRDNDKNGNLSINDVLFRTSAAIAKIEDTNDKELLRRRMETDSGSDDKIDAVDEDDNIVLNNNMEIFVKMNKPFD